MSRYYTTVTVSAQSTEHLAFRLRRVFVDPVKGYIFACCVCNRKGIARPFAWLASRCSISPGMVDVHYQVICRPCIMGGFDMPSYEQGFRQIVMQSCCAMAIRHLRMGRLSSRTDLIVPRDIFDSRRKKAKRRLSRKKVKDAAAQR